MFDFAKTSLVTLSETSIQIILVKKMQNTRSHDEAIFGFLRNNVVLPFFVVKEINTIGKNHFQIKLKSITGEVFLSYQVKNEKLLINELNTFPMNLSLSKIAPKEAEIQSRFTDCVKGWFGYFNESPVTGLVCMAFGAECAAVITGNCLAKQVES